MVRGFMQKKKYEKFEIYAPVAKTGVVRVVLAIANKLGLPLHQLDVKTAFLYGDLDEDIYVKIPKGFGKEEKFMETSLFKFKKSVYGLKVSPKKWNEKFCKVMKEIGVTTDPAEPCLFIWREKEEFVILCLYVDDIIMTGTNTEMISRILGGS